MLSYYCKNKERITVRYLNRLASFVIISGLLSLGPSKLNAQIQSGLPETFPEIQVNVYDNPEPGYIFITPCGLWGHFPDASHYLAILDNHGMPVFYEELERPAFDFKLQPDGSLTFYDGGYDWVHQIMNASYDIESSDHIIGYSGTDFHEFKILDNGHHLLLGYEDRIVDMDTVVPGGQPGVTVRGTLIQEKDTNGVVIWEWSSWGHLEITETDTANVDLTHPSFIDYVHANAIEPDTDTSIMISCRNMHEITRISRVTGDVIWRMGGSQNEFSFIGNDTLGFSGQHDIRKLKNGNCLLFDNGWHHPEQVSSAYEFQIDEVNKTVTTVKRYRSQPEDITGWIMGSSQRLPGGNTLVGWGSGVPNVTEFKPDGTKALEFEFESVSYRAYKFPWKTNLISGNTDTLDFGEIHFENEAEQDLYVTNHYDSDIELTWMHTNTEKYHCTTDLPALIEPGDSLELTIKFLPEEVGEFNDVLTIYAEKLNQTKVSAFAIQVMVCGSASEDASVTEIHLADVEVFPSPTKGIINLKKPGRYQLSYSITNVNGYSILSGNIGQEKKEFRFDISAEAPGIYFLRLVDNLTGQYTVKRIIKH